MFSVSSSGSIASTGLYIKESSADHPYSPALGINFNKNDNLFSFSTSSYPGGPGEKYYPMRFLANEFTFDKGDMVVNGAMTLKDSVAIGGGLEVQKETVLDSMLQVKGKTVLDSTLQVKGETVLNSTLQVRDKTDLRSTLQVRDKTDLNSMLQVKGVTALDSTLQVKGKTVLDSMLQVKGETVLDSMLQVKGMTVLDSTLQVNGVTVLDSTLQVNGVTVLDSTLQVNGVTVLDSTLQVNGVTVLGSTLQVKGKTVLDSTLQLKGETVLDSTLQVKGETVLDSTLQVKGVTVLDSTLQVKNGATFSEDVKVWGETNLSTLKINIPTIQVDKSGAKERVYGNFIDCHDVLTPAYNNMFKVSYDGHVGAVSLGLSESPLDNGYSAKFHCGYNKTDEAWLIDTESYGGEQKRFYPIIFKAGGYTFDNGDMVVNGKLTCRNELNVLSLNADDVNVNMKNVADYVFDENYNLKSLSEVESFVKENKHLPGIPSAAEMEENGVSLAKMSNMLLEKVEELTLHLIRLEKENAELKAKFEALEK